MDFKALRAARNKKAEERVNSSGGKVDSSDWTPSEPLDTDAKTGMRPISRRAFKTGGKVDGGEAKTNLSRAPRGGLSEKIGLANTNQKDANEDREGKKHVGGFKKGGMVTSSAAGDTGGRIAKAKAGAVDDVGSSEQDGGPEKVFTPAPPPAGMLRPKKRPEVNPTTGDFETPEETQKRLNSYSNYKKGGAAKKKYEGSPKDNMADAKMAKKMGMTHKEWEKSPEDKRMDAKGQREMDEDGGGNWIKDAIKKPGALSKSLHVAEDKNIPMSKIKKAEESDNPKLAKRAQLAETLKYMHKDGGDCTCSKCRTARKSGGKVKGKTNIVINVMPHTAAKPEMQPAAPMPPVAAPPPMAGGMPPAPPMRLPMPAGLGAAMAGAAGAPPAPPGAPMPMPMARKSGGKVYPITTGAGGGKARLDKIKAYGLEQAK